MNRFHDSWASLPLGQLASEMCLGKMLDKEKNRGVLRPYLRNVNVRWFGFDLADMKEMRFEESEGDRFGLKAGDLVVCEGGEPGRAAVWNGQLAGVRIQKALHRIRFDNGHYDPHFAAYYLYFGTLTDQFADLYTGTTINHLTGKAISRVTFPLPPLNEQRRIVAKLDEQFSDLDAAVAALRRVKEKLKRYRTSVLKAAIEGKLTAEWRQAHPATKPATALLERILAERRRRWEDAQRAKFAAGKSPPKQWETKYQEPAAVDAGALLPLPKRWCWVKVDQLGDVQLGRQRSPDNTSNKYPTKYIRAANLTERGLDISDVLEMEFLPREKETYVLRPGDLLLSEASGSPDQVGKPVIWRGELDDCCFQNTVIRLRPVGIDSEYLLNLFRYLYFTKIFAKVSAGVGINHLSAAKFAGLVVPLPPADEQAEIVREIEARLTIVDQVTAQIDANLKRAGRLRQGILKRAFEGKLVSQDPADEPAAVLLERIRRQRLAVPKKVVKPAGGKLARAALENIGRAIAYCLTRATKPHGRTWLAKVLALGELHVGVPLQQRLTRQKFGPLDETIYKAERMARKAGWFDFTDQAKSKEKTTYHVTDGTPAAAATGAEFLADRREAFDDLLADFDGLGTDDAELFATAYAAWNDLLLDGRPADEDAVVAEFYAWDESKAKFARGDILDRIAWMRRQGYVPTGQGRRTAVVEKPKARAKRRPEGRA